MKNKNTKKKIIALASIAVLLGVALVTSLSSGDLQGARRNKLSVKTTSSGNSNTSTPPAPPASPVVAHVNITTPGGSSGFSGGGWLTPPTIETCTGNETEWTPILQTYMIIVNQNFRLDRLPFMAKKAGPNGQDPQNLKMTVSTDHQNWQGSAIGEYVVNNPESMVVNPGGYFLIETGGLELAANTTYYLTFSVQRNPITLTTGENYQVLARIQTGVVQLAGTNYGEFVPGGPTVGGLITPTNLNTLMNVHQMMYYTNYNMAPCSN